MKPVRIIVAGAGGRMGRAVIAEVLKTPGVTLAGGLERDDSEALGADLGTLAGMDGLGLKVGPAGGVLPRADALIDFTAPGASIALAAKAAAAGVAHVIGTTGFGEDDAAVVEEAAKKIPVVKSANMSLGVNLLAALVEQAAARLSDDYDIEIVEAHHRLKVDAPSGTALLLGEAAAKGRGVPLDERSVRIRDGHTGVRRAGDIGFAVIRGGGIVGDHEVMFAGLGEVLTLSHKAIDRGLFASGAVAAALWAAGGEPGLYSMRDVFGLKPY